MPATAPASRVANLSAELQELEFDGSPDGEREKAKIRAKLRRIGHDDIHPGESLVGMDVPFDATGKTFKINDQEFHGYVVVPACVAQTLAYMIDQNRRTDLERMRESGGNTFLGTISQRAQVIKEN